MRTKPPCKASGVDCPRRAVGCHAGCEEYQKWQENKEQRKAKLRITMYDRYGIIPQKYDLRDDVISLGLNKEDYSELFKEDE